jgi:hypothetical protein
MEKKTIQIYVAGGVVTDVSALPPGWSYEIFEEDESAEDGDEHRAALTRPLLDSFLPLAARARMTSGRARVGYNHHHMKEKSKAAQELGRLGGKARAAKLTPQERSESARRAVEAREEKRKAQRTTC